MIKIFMTFFLIIFFMVGSLSLYSQETPDSKDEKPKRAVLKEYTQEDIKKMKEESKKEKEGTEEKTDQKEIEPKILSFVSLGGSKLNTWTLGTDYVDGGVTFNEDVYKRLELSMDLFDDKAFKFVGEFESLSKKFRQIFFSFGFKSWGIVLEAGNLNGEIDAGLLDLNGTGANGVSKQKKNFDGKYRHIFFYYRMSRESIKEIEKKAGRKVESYEKNFQIGFSYRTWEVPFEYSYRYRRGTNSYDWDFIDFVDSDTKISSYGFGMIYDPMKTIHNKMADKQIFSDNGFYFYASETVGYSVIKLSDESENNLKAIYPSAGVKDKTWGGLGFSGGFELGWFFAKSVMSYNFTLQIGYAVRNISVMSFKKYFDPGFTLEDLEIGELAPPDDMLFQYGPSLKFSMSF